jgi:hypothetical protein
VVFLQQWWYKELVMSEILSHPDAYGSLAALPIGSRVEVRLAMMDPIDGRPYLAPADVYPPKIGVLCQTHRPEYVGLLPIEPHIAQVRELDARDHHVRARNGGTKKQEPKHTNLSLFLLEQFVRDDIVFFFVGRAAH